MDPQKARFQRKRQRNVGSEFQQFQDQYDVNNEKQDKAIMKTLRKQEEGDQEIKIRQNQINYFGYIIEPLNMKEERERGEVDDDGNLRVRLDFHNDPWLNQLEEEEQKKFQKVYSAQMEKGVFNDINDIDENIEQIQKKVKLNEEKSKYEGTSTDDLLKELQNIINQQDLTIKEKIQMIKNEIQKNEKPQIMFKKNMRQKEKEELQKKLEEWEKNKLTEQELEEKNKQLQDILEISNELQFRFEIQEIFTLTLESLIEKINQQNAQKQQEGGEFKAQLSDLDAIPQHLLEKLNKGELNEDEQEQIRIILMRQRMQQQEESDDDVVVNPNIMDVSEDEDEDEEENEQDNAKQKQQNQIQQQSIRINQQQQLNQQKEISQQNQTQEQSKQAQKVQQKVQNSQKLQKQQQEDEEYDMFN